MSDAKPKATPKGSQKSRSSKDWTARAIALISLLMFGGYVFLVTVKEPSENADPIVTLVLGYLGGIVSSVVSFYFGASHKHDDKV